MMPFNSFGSYLVRDSESSPGNYALSVRDIQKVKHYRIRQLENGRFAITQRATFQTIIDLVTNYQRQADGLCVNLIKPCALSENSDQIAGLRRQTNEEWETDRRQVRLVRKLMSSEFVEVWEGLWNGITPVAVKTPRPQQTITVE